MTDKEPTQEQIMERRLTTNWACPDCGQIVSTGQRHDESNCESFKAGIKYEEDKWCSSGNKLLKDFPWAAMFWQELGNKLFMKY